MSAPIDDVPGTPPAEPTTPPDVIGPPPAEPAFVPKAEGVPPAPQPAEPQPAEPQPAASGVALDPTGEPARPLLAEAEAPPTRDLPFSFTGTAGEYFRIWIVNVVLSVLTLGIYSAWAKKRTRQYFYRHSVVDGTGFEYLADPLQILKGRVIVAVLFAALFGLQAVDPALYLGGLVLFVIATPAMLVSAMRFNAKNSAWRNIRFHFDADSSDAYKLYLNIFGLYIVTCGLAVPYVQWMWFGFVIKNHRFGEQSLEWLTRATDVITLYIYMVPMFIVVYVLFIGGMIAIGSAAALLPDTVTGGVDDPKAVEDIISVASIVMLPLFYAGLAVPGAFFKARMANLMFNGIRVGSHTFRSEQTFGELLKIYLVNLVALVFTLGLAWPWVKVRLAAYRLSRLTLVAQGPLLVNAGAPSADASALGDAAVDFGELDLDLGF